MSDKTAIAWTDATWNPVTGCSKVSPGCAHCYAETLALTRLRGREGYPGLPWTPENAAANVVLRRERLDQPLRWRRPRRIFVNSLSDLFHEQVPEAFIDRVFAMMAITDRHTYQVLTKRPERMLAYATHPETPTRIGEATREFARPGRGPESSFGAHIFDNDGRGYREPGFRWRTVWPLPNVWLGTSVENQRWADARIPELLATPAAVRFLSLEPLLGPLDLSGALRISWRCSGCGRFYSGPLQVVCPGCGRQNYWSGSHEFNPPHRQTGPGVGWIIVGGESGPGHRPMDPAWARSIVDQADAAGVRVFVKQASGSRSGKQGDLPHDLWARREFPR